MLAILKGVIIYAVACRFLSGWVLKFLGIMPVVNVGECSDSLGGNRHQKRMPERWGQSGALATRQRQWTPTVRPLGPAAMRGSPVPMARYGGRTILQDGSPRRRNLAGLRDSQARVNWRELCTWFSPSTARKKRAAEAAPSWWTLLCLARA